MKQHFLKKTVFILLLFSGLIMDPEKMQAQSNYCRTEFPPNLVLNDAYEDACSTNDSVFNPNNFTDTIVVNVAIYALNKANGTGALNNFADSTFEHWIDNVNYLYSHIQPSNANVPGTQYIQDTKIRFNLIGIFHPNVTITSDLIDGFTLPTLLPNAISLILSPGVDGDGVRGGYGQAYPPNKRIHFLIDSTNIITSNYSISHRYMWAAHELGHALGLDHTGRPHYSATLGVVNTDPDAFSDTYYPDYMWGGPCFTNDSIFFQINDSTRHFCGIGPNPNNIMGYGANCEEYFSPQQMAQMRARLVRVIPEVCQGNVDHPYCLSDNITTFIDSGEVAIYNGVHSMPGNIEIEEGSILIITGCVHMPENARIIVGPGATLVVDGGTISTRCTGTFWDGIEVRGAYNTGQTYSGSTVVLLDSTGQGVCVIKNHSTIERARIGVYVGGRNTNPANPAIDLKLAGGILQVDSSSFVNCQRGIFFCSYKAQNKKGTKSHIRNSFFGPSSVSLLAETDFINNIYRPVKFQTAISLTGISRVEITGNVFKAPVSGAIDHDFPTGVTTTIYNTNPEATRGTAIYAINSELYVRKNKFNDLREGIRAYNNYSLYKSSHISNNYFKSNLFGITGNISFAKIDSNTFVVPESLMDTVNIPVGSSPYPWGIYLDNSNTFKCRLDSFIVGSIGSSDGGNPPSIFALNPPSAYGLIIKNSGPIGGTVKDNCVFQGLKVGTQTEMNNPALQIRCNKYDNNENAWRVNPASTAGVLGPQGSSCNPSPSTEYRANNIFTSCGMGKDRLESYLQNAWDYYYWNNSLDGTDDVFEPCVFVTNGTVNSNPCMAGNPDPNACAAQSLSFTELPEIRELMLAHLDLGQTDSIIELLKDHVAHNEVKKLLIAAYLSSPDTNDYVKAAGLLDSLNTDSTEGAKFYILYDFYYSKRANHLPLEATDSTKRAQLFAHTSPPTAAGAELSALLEYLDPEQYPYFIIPEISDLKAARFAKKQDVIAAAEEQPDLGQNIPNPANNSTQINVYIPDSKGSGSIRIINSLGQLMAEQKVEKGRQQVVFNTGDLAGGIYFYTLYVDNKPCATKRMVIVK
jgi:hypothetical protein